MIITKTTRKFYLMKRNDAKVVLPLQSIQHIIDYITDDNVKEILTDLVNRIYNCGGSNFSIKNLNNPCDFGFYNGKKRLIFFVCRKNFFHLNICGSIDIVPQSSRCFYEKRERFISRFKVSSLNNNDVDEIISIIKQALETGKDVIIQ